MRTTLIAVTCFGLCAVSGTSLLAETQVPGSRVYQAVAQNGSHETGTVALKPRGGNTDVEIHLLNAPKGVSQPAHIHLGTCKSLDPAPKYPLEPVLDGTSDGVVHVSIATLLKSPMAVNVHASAANLKTYVACADLKP
jgi:hypothetical protein